MRTIALSRILPRWSRNLMLALAAIMVGPAPVRALVTIDVGAAGKPISPDLFGIFFEDINYAADGGLYAELVQNGSFEYQSTEQTAWNPLSFWEVAVRGDGKGSMAVESADPLDANNPHYCVLEVAEPGDGVGLANGGYDGIPVTAGQKYDVSVFAKQLYLGGRWNPDRSGKPASLLACLENRTGQRLGQVLLGAPAPDWTHLRGTITATDSDAGGRLVVYVDRKGGWGLDMVSLMPQKTFHDHANGLRPDLAEVIADLHPKFIRFPGGCVAHGNGLGNMYRWKATVGPLEQRRQQADLWGYHQSAGLGYFEYFQFCEDIGAKPLPVIAAAVCCQNSDHTGGTGQRGLPLSAMPDYIQDILDLIEWANGPADSAWGSKRAAAGHAAPFHLEYLAIGNEDAQTEVFRERFKMIYQAVKAKHPEITLIGTVGPAPSGPDYDAGWKFAREQKLEMVDEHGYQSPDWFWQNRSRFDAYDRSQARVYLGEYAAHDTGRANTLRSALAEAAYMTSLERNGDVVRLASYAPLLAKEGHTQWRPDMIYFNNSNVLCSVNYYVQQLFAKYQGDTFLPAAVGGDLNADSLAISCVQNSADGELILKLVNRSTNAVETHLDLSALGRIQTDARRTVLTGDPNGVNTWGHPSEVVPVTSSFVAGRLCSCELLPNSLNVIRVKTR